MEKTELIELIDYDFIEEYYYDGWIKDLHLEDLVIYVDIFNFIDDKQFVGDWIESEVESRISDFDYNYDTKWEKDEYLIPYITGSNISEKEITNAFIESRGLEIDTDDEEEIEEIEDLKGTYDIDEMLEDMSPKELRSLVEDCGDVHEFVTELIEDMYKNYTAYDLLREYYSEDEMRSEKICEYHNITYYVDEDEIRQYLRDNEDYSHMIECLSDQLENSLSLQVKVFEADNNSIFDLFDMVYEEELGERYDFQKAYMEEKPEEIVELSNKFELHLQILDEYEEYLYLLEANKFDLV